MNDSPKRKIQEIQDKEERINQYISHLHERKEKLEEKNKLMTVEEILKN